MFAMSRWALRDRILAGILTNGTDYQNFSSLRTQFPNIDSETLQKALNWLARRNLIWADSSVEGEISTFKITAVGEDLVELDQSTELFARQSVEGAVVNQQLNFNSSASVNSLGDKNVFRVEQFRNPTLQEITSDLRKFDLNQEADELEQIERSRGPKAAFKKILEWINEKVLDTAVIAAIAPQAIEAAASSS